MPAWTLQEITAFVLTSQEQMRIQADTLDGCVTLPLNKSYKPAPCHDPCRPNPVSLSFMLLRVFQIYGTTVNDFRKPPELVSRGWTVPKARGCSRNHQMALACSCSSRGLADLRSWYSGLDSGTCSSETHTHTQVTAQGQFWQTTSDPLCYRGSHTPPLLLSMAPTASAPLPHQRRGKNGWTLEDENLSAYAPFVQALVTKHSHPSGSTHAEAHTTHLPVHLSSVSPERAHRKLSATSSVPQS